MSAYHPRQFDPRQDTARMSMRCGVMASLWEQVPHLHECRYPDSTLVGEATDSSFGELLAVLLTESQEIPT